MLVCGSTALGSPGSARCYHVPCFRERSVGIVRAIHSSMLLHNSGKVNNRAVLLPNLKVMPLLPHNISFEVFPSGLQPLSLQGPHYQSQQLLQKQQHSQTSSFTTTYLVIQR